MARFLLYPHLSLFDKAELAYLLAPFIFAVYEVFSTEKRRARFLLVVGPAAHTTRPERPGSIPGGSCFAGVHGAEVRRPPGGESGSRPIPDGTSLAVVSNN